MKHIPKHYEQKDWAKEIQGSWECAPKVVAVVQARMSSARLPGKVLLSLASKPVLWWICARCILANRIDNIVVATTSDPSNDPIADKHYLPYGCEAFRYEGDENDVIGRVLAAADQVKTDIIVDITADCPMIDPRHIDHLIKMLIKNDLDYVSNCVRRTWPDGFDVQVYTREALAWTKGQLNPKQHAGWNIARHPEVFKIMNWPASSDMHWPDLGLTLDTREDYVLLQILFREFGDDPAFAVEDVVKFLKANPELVEINKGIRRKTPEEG